MLLDGSVPVKYGLRLNSEMKYWDLKRQLSELCNGALDPEQMLICELSNSQIRFILPNEQRIKPSTACELYVYELPKVDGVLRSRAGSELGINIEKGLKDIQRNQGTVKADSRGECASLCGLLVVSFVALRADHIVMRSCF